MDRSQEFNLETIVNSGGVGRSQFLIIAICVLVAMIDGFDTQCVAFVAPEIANHWQVEPSKFGPVFGAGRVQETGLDAPLRGRGRFLSADRLLAALSHPPNISWREEAMSALPRNAAISAK